MTIHYYGVYDSPTSSWDEIYASQFMKERGFRLVSGQKINFVEIQNLRQFFADYLN